jgi:hypothetical protein
MATLPPCWILTLDDVTGLCASIPMETKMKRDLLSPSVLAAATVPVNPPCRRHGQSLVRTLALAGGALTILCGSNAFAQRAASTLMSFSISSPIKPDGGCPTITTGDWDYDCLYDTAEKDLAWLVSPHVIWDEVERCIGWNDPTSTYAMAHFAPRDSFQVRPDGKGSARPVSAWTSSDGQAKFVNVSFVFNYPWDCSGKQDRWYNILSDHMGDNENIILRFYTYDLKTFYLDSATYFEHGGAWDHPGDWMKCFSTAAGTSYPIVLSSGNTHASYRGAFDSRPNPSASAFCKSHNEWGNGATSSACGPGVREYDYCTAYSAADGGVAASIRNSKYYFPAANRPMGELYDGNGNLKLSGLANYDATYCPTCVIQFEYINGSLAYYQKESMDPPGQPKVYGPWKEYWNRIGNFDNDNAFCGWQCPDTRRATGEGMAHSGDCLENPFAGNPQDGVDCSSVLADKFDKSPYVWYL